MWHHFPPKTVKIKNKKASEIFGIQGSTIMQIELKQIKKFTSSS